MPAKKAVNKTNTQNASAANKETPEQVQIEITRALLGIVAISIFIIFVINR